MPGETAIATGETCEIDVLALVGATGVGKSALGVWLGARLGGEVVNFDSMQLYRGMDIGTGKLTLDDRQGVPHHMLDVWDVSKSANVAEFQRLARDVISDIRGRGRLPILVGGSGLYLRAVIDDFRFPGHDRVVRAQWESQLAERGSTALHRELATRDPAAAAAILPSNGRRIVRALEVTQLAGMFQASLPEERQHLACLQIGLSVSRDRRERSIAARVNKMLERGWLDEVALLREAGFDSAPTASRAVGYSQMSAVLDGRMDKRQAAADVVSATGRLARRQCRWFRRDKRVVWMSADDGDLLRAAALARCARLSRLPS